MAWITIGSKALNSTYTLRLQIDDSYSQSVPNNTSSVPYRLQIYAPGSSSWSSYTQYGSLTINGSSRSVPNFTYDFSQYDTLTIASGTISIEHTSNGTKTFSFSASISTSGNLPSGSLSGSYKLKDIPRASTVTTFADFLIGNNIPWVVDRKYAAFTHTIKLIVGGTEIASATGQGASGTLGINAAAKELILSKLGSTSKTVSATLAVDTYSGNTKIGSTQSKVATGTARDDDIRPTASITSIVEGASGLSAFSGTFVQNKSKLNVKSSGSAKYGASIKEYRVTIDGVHSYGSDITSAIISKDGTLTVVLRAMDTRNVPIEVSTTVTIVQYFEPKITKFVATRYPTQESTNLRVQYAFEIAPVSNKNTKTVIIRYRRKGQTNTNVVNSTANYSADTTHISNGILNANYSYEVDIILRDRFNTGDLIIMSTEIGTGWEFMNFNASGKGLALGKVSEKANDFEINMDTHILKTLKDKDGILFHALGGVIVEYDE